MPGRASAGDLIKFAVRTINSLTLQEAVDLLTSKLSTAQTSLDNTVEDLEFLREQLTIMEVNTARVYNWDVKRRRDLRERERLEAEREKEK